MGIIKFVGLMFVMVGCFTGIACGALFSQIGSNGFLSEPSLMQKAIWYTVGGVSMITLMIIVAHCQDESYRTGVC